MYSVTLTNTIEIEVCTGRYITCIDAYKFQFQFLRDSNKQFYAVRLRSYL